MCAIFGLIDYKKIFTAVQRECFMNVLASECEIRGTDATGFAFNSGEKLRIYKRPVAAHEISLKLDEDANVILGHTRMATQGDCKKNYNNHPFYGKVRNTKFALAHNGIVYNDHKIASDMKLPKSRIETDSYVAVQLLEKSGELSEKTLAEMAEKINGPFVFTLLDEENNSYFVRGDNPLALASARARGRKGGRPSADCEAVRKAVRLYKTGEYTAKEITELTGVRKTTLYKNVRKT